MRQGIAQYRAGHFPGAVSCFSEAALFIARDPEDSLAWRRGYTATFAIALALGRLDADETRLLLEQLPPHSGFYHVAKKLRQALADNQGVLESWPIPDDNLLSTLQRNIDQLIPGESIGGLEAS